MPLATGEPGRLADALRPLLRDVGDYSRVLLPQQRLRGYQLLPARAIAESVVHGLGRQFAVVFSRQAGKDETLAQLVAWLLTRCQRRGGNVVLAAPAMTQALVSRLKQSPLSVGRVRQREGYIVEVGQASARFLSAAESANPRGQTASLLLVANEAQDIDPAIWDARFDPMAASTNATTVFLGTVWDRNGLLHRQMAHLAEMEARDGVQRVYKAPWGVVSEELPAYGERVRARIEQFGPQHPFIRTEYELEVLDGEGGLFPPQRIAQLQEDHRVSTGPSRASATPGLLDVAGEEEAGAGRATSITRAAGTSTALTVVEVDARGRELPAYRVVDRMAWTGSGTRRCTRSCWTWCATCGACRRWWWTRRGSAGLASFLGDALSRGATAGDYEAVRVQRGVEVGSSAGTTVGLIDGGRLRSTPTTGRN
ncbi:MAG: hypothetical protein R2853_21140 [Thermomicrobiales bacterium]